MPTKLAWRGIYIFRTDKPYRAERDVAGIAKQSVLLSKEFLPNNTEKKRFAEQSAGFEVISRIAGAKRSNP